MLGACCGEVAHKGFGSLPVDLAQQAFGCLVPLTVVRRIQTGYESLGDNSGADYVLILLGEDALLIILGEVGNGLRCVTNPLVYLPLESCLVLLDCLPNLFDFWDSEDFAYFGFGVVSPVTFSQRYSI